MTTFPFPLLASLPDHPGLGQSLLFQLTGLTVVLMALCSIWAAVSLISLFFRRSSQKAAAGVVTPSAAPAAAGPDPATVAVIAAAVQVALGGRHRIHSIAAADPTADWAREGRRHIFASHQVR